MVSWKTTTSVVLISFLISGVQLQRARSIGINKTIVKYLGIDFLLRDGCPLPPCDTKYKACRKLQLDTQTNYKSCLRYTAIAKFVQCIKSILHKINRFQYYVTRSHIKISGKKQNQEMEQPTQEEV